VLQTPWRFATKRNLWGYSGFDPNLVEVLVSSLRRKLERHGPRLIHTVRGRGYRLAETP
jgi:DNA-binding response OmpR family regulator